MAQAWPPRRIWTGRFHSGLTHLDLRVGRRLLLLRLRVALSGAAVLRRRPSASAACRESRAGEAVLLHGARRHTAAQLAVTRHSCIMPNRLHATVPSCTPTSASCTGHPAISHSRLPPPTGVVPGLSLSLCPVCDMPGSQSRQSEGARLPPGVAPWLRPLCLRSRMTQSDHTCCRRCGTSKKNTRWHLQCRALNVDAHREAQN